PTAARPCNTTAVVFISPAGFSCAFRPDKDEGSKLRAYQNSKTFPTAGFFFFALIGGETGNQPIRFSPSPTTAAVESNTPHLPQNLRRQHRRKVRYPRVSLARKREPFGRLSLRDQRRQHQP